MGPRTVATKQKKSSSVGQTEGATSSNENLAGQAMDVSPEDQALTKDQDEQEEGPSRAKSVTTKVQQY